MKVLNCCFVEAVQHHDGWLATSIEALDDVLEARLGEGRERGRANARARAIRRSRVGRSPPPLSVLVVIHALTDANLRAVVVAPVTFAVERPTRLYSMSRLGSRPANISPDTPFRRHGRRDQRRAAYQ